MTEVTMTTETTTPAPPPVPGEYPLSTLCLKVRVGEVEMSWTLRGDDSDVARRLPRALATIKALQDKGTLPPGRGQGQAQGTPTEPQPPLEEREDWCEIHGTGMGKQANERGSWYSHKTPEGTWCKGKRRKAGA